MSPQSLRKRFNTSKDELAKLGLEFNAEALPLLEKLYSTTFWTILNQRASIKIIRQTFYEAIENCDITKNNVDWDSWMHRIWMREILEYYSTKENDTQTVFDFIDHAKVNPDEVKNFFNSPVEENHLIKYLEKIPAVLRIPMMMKEVHLLDYERISDLIDVPIGVIATRIFRARKLLYLFFRGNFNYEEQKRIGIQQGASKLIFELRQSALLVDDEFTSEQKKSFLQLMDINSLYKTEVLVQNEIKKLFISLSPEVKVIRSIKAKVEKKATRRFG
jgi:DNA-directed RNA polymerase specialized sigma24 family protein